MSAAPGKVRPSGFWYLLPFLLVIAGGVAAIISIVSGVSAYSDTIEDFARVDVGEQGTIEIDGTGGYTVFYEPGVSDESSLEENDPEPPLEMTDPSGQPVTFEDYESFGTYGSSGYVGFAIRTFDVSQPGNYELKVGRPAARRHGRGRAQPVREDHQRRRCSAWCSASVASSSRWWSSSC